MSYSKVYKKVGGKLREKDCMNIALQGLLADGWSLEKPKPAPKKAATKKATTKKAPAKKAKA